MTTIPQELSDMIVDYLHDDKPSLGTCGLVCRSWLPSSRFHLFSTFWLFQFDRDLSVLCALGSSIPPFVRDLHMNDCDSGGLPCFPQALLQLPPLPAIQGLYLTDVTWDLLTLEVKERLFTLTRCVKSLSLELMWFNTPGQILECLASAPSLERLTMHSVECHSDSEDVSLTQFTAPRLKEITLGKIYPPVVLGWLRLGHPIPSVHSLSLDLFRSGDVCSIATADFLKFLGPVLEHLEIHSDSLQHGSLCNELDLGQNVSLRTISFSLWGRLSGSGAQSWMISVLSKITSRYIKRVMLNTYLDSPEELTALNPPSLSALFIGGGSAFAEQATILRIGISGLIDRVEARTAIREAFCDLHSQGRLETRVRWSGSEL